MEPIAYPDSLLRIESQISRLLNSNGNVTIFLLRPIAGICLVIALFLRLGRVNYTKEKRLRMLQE